MPDRRSFLQRAATWPLVGSLVPATQAASAQTRDYFGELGVRTFINAAGTYTMFTASLMPPEVVEAIAYASKSYVALAELQDKVGARLAAMLGSEAAMVTAGAASALTCGTAACITGKNPDAIRRIPDLAGLKNEVIIQRSHRYGYDHAVRACGVRMVEIETAEELSNAVNERTAMMLFFHGNENVGKIGSEEFIALAKKHRVPAFVDAAANVPPVENLFKHIKLGYDLVTFSGGKGLRGPQSAGLLYGRKDLIEAARLNTSPYSDSIARGQKVNKEEMLGMLVALELYLKRDHAADWKEWERRVKHIADTVARFPSVTTSTWMGDIADRVPHLRVQWDQQRIRLTPLDVADRLRKGTPSIEVTPNTNKEQLVIGVWMMQPGDAEIVARRVAEELRKGRG